MFLLINTSERDKIHLALFDEDKKFEKVFEGQNRELLASIDVFLKQKNIEKKNLKGIMVVVGSGSFTSTRIAAVVANSFGYVLQIPLLSITKDEIKDIQGLILKLRKQKPGIFISAQYSGKPNITKAKK